MFTKGKCLRMLALTANVVFISSEAMSQATPPGTGPVPRVQVQSQLFNPYPRFEAGVQVGPGLGWMRGNKVIDNTDALFGPAAGICLQYNLSSRLGIRLGAGYQQKGSSTDVTFTDINGTSIAEGTVRNELQYFNFPLMLRAGFGKKFRVSVGAGGYAGMLMSARQTSRGFNFPDVTVTDDFKALDLGISASLAGALALDQRFALNAEARYDKGLTNISALPVIDDGSIRTNAVCFMVGCSYRFGGALIQ